MHLESRTINCDLGNKGFAVVHAAVECRALETARALGQRRPTAQDTSKLSRLGVSGNEMSGSVLSQFGGLANLVRFS